MKNRLKMAMAAAEMLYSEEGREDGWKEEADGDGRRQVIKTRGSLWEQVPITSSSSSAQLSCERPFRLANC